MATILKVAATIVKLEPHKSNEFERGTKKILVNGEHWGWVHTQWHGSHGTTFHLSDLHGTLYRPVPRRDNPDAKTDVMVRSPNKRHLKIANIGKANPAPIPSNDSIILRLIDDAIQNNWLRSPATRAAEREAVRAKGAKLHEEAKHKQDTVWNNRIDLIMKLGFNTSPDSRGPMIQFEAVQLRQAIHDAMKWAQVQ